MRRSFVDIIHWSYIWVMENIYVIKLGVSE